MPCVLLYVYERTTRTSRGLGREECHRAAVDGTTTQILLLIYCHVTRAELSRGDDENEVRAGKALSCTGHTVLVRPIASSRMIGTTAAADGTTPQNTPTPNPPPPNLLVNSYSVLTFYYCHIAVSTTMSTEPQQRVHDYSLSLVCLKLGHRRGLGFLKPAWWRVRPSAPPCTCRKVCERSGQNSHKTSPSSVARVSASWFERPP